MSEKQTLKAATTHSIFGGHRAASLPLIFFYCHTERNTIPALEPCRVFESGSRSIKKAQIRFCNAALFLPRDIAFELVWVKAETVKKRIVFQKDSAVLSYRFKRLRNTAFNF